jgi:hypothetical protein
VFEGFEFVELEPAKRGDLGTEVLEGLSALGGQETELSGGGGAMNREVEGDASQGEAGGQEKSDLLVEVALFLSKAGMGGRTGEGPSAAEAAETGDPVPVRGPEEATAGDGSRTH